MKVYKRPLVSEWSDLCKRPVRDPEELQKSLLDILSNVREQGDLALRSYAEKFDGVTLDSLSIATDEALVDIPETLSDSLKRAYDAITLFHEAQLPEQGPVIETYRGVRCWRKPVPIQAVGLYVPGGSAPLISTVLMLGVPAKIAGCPVRVLCTPPQKETLVHPAIVYAAKLCGIEQIYLSGGAQAIAAMAYGTESIPEVDKIFGPGNQFVDGAKRILSGAGKVAIDLPAGPSELLVVADSTAPPEFVAADLLSQAEHGGDSQVVLVTECEELLSSVQRALATQLETLPRKAIASEALTNSFAVLLSDLDEAMAFSNTYAPEHLILQTENAEELASCVVNAGSVFVGSLTPESAGDYASGTNHTLPTAAAAKAYSGVGVDSFMKWITFQSIDSEGLKEIGPVIQTLASAEELEAHRQAVFRRLI